MAACSPDKFVITKGMENTFVFTIKQNDSTLPMVIVTGDTFTADLQLLSTGAVAITKVLTVIDALSGKVSLVLTELEIAGLTGEKGSKVDRYYLKPMYKLLIDCVTVNNGKFIAKVPEVYVD